MVDNGGHVYTCYRYVHGLPVVVQGAAEERIRENKKEHTLTVTFSYKLFLDIGFSFSRPTILARMRPTARHLDAQWATSYKGFSDCTNSQIAQNIITM